MFIVGYSCHNLEKGTTRRIACVYLVVWRGSDSLVTLFFGQWSIALASSGRKPPTVKQTKTCKFQRWIFSDSLGAVPANKTWSSGISGPLVHCCLIQKQQQQQRRRRRVLLLCRTTTNNNNNNSNNKNNSNSNNNNNNHIKRKRKTQ